MTLAKTIKTFFTIVQKINKKTEATAFLFFLAKKTAQRIFVSTVTQTEKLKFCASYFSPKSYPVFPVFHLLIPIQRFKLRYIQCECSSCWTARPPGLSDNWLPNKRLFLFDTCTNLSSLREASNLGLHPSFFPPPVVPFIHPLLIPLPLSSTSNYLSIYLFIGPDRLSQSGSSSFAVFHQHFYSWHANSCLTVMALKAEQDASQCVWLCMCVHVHVRV